MHERLLTYLPNRKSIDHLLLEAREREEENYQTYESNLLD